MRYFYWSICYIKVELRMKACLDTFRFLSAEVSWNCQELHYLTSRI